MIASMVYLSYYLFEAPPTGYFDGAGATFFRLLIGATSFILLYLEYGSAFNGQVKTLTVMLPNLVTVSAIILTNAVVFSHSMAYDIDQLSNLAQIASVTMVLQWGMLLYWLRIFKEMALYVILVIKTMKEIAYFTIMFLGCIFTFANAIYILNRQRLYVDPSQDISILATNITISEEEVIDPLYDAAVSNGVINAIIN
jgi:hypothetical protein